MANFFFLVFGVGLGALLIPDLRVALPGYRITTNECWYRR